MPTINGRACVVNGSRNLLLDTEFNNLPQYWTSRAGTVTGTFNGHNVIYYDATKFTGGFTDVLQQPIYNPNLTTNRVLPSQWYTLSFYAKGVGKLNSYVYPDFVDSNAGGYVDGVKWSYINLDGSNVWDLTNKWARHTYTFKSRSSLSNTDVQAVLFRVFKGSEVYICMPKLEVGTLATPYSPTPVDKVFSNGRQVYGRNLLQGTRDFSGIYSGDKVSVTNGGEKFQAVTGTFQPSSSPDPYLDIVCFNNLPLEKDTDYTASFWVKTSEDTDITSYLYDSGSNGVYSDEGTKNHSTTDYTRIVVHFHNGNNNATPNFIPARINKVGVTVWIYGCMLEKGTVATPWSPAPEDVM